MHQSTSPTRNKFKLVAIASTALIGIGATAAILAGITPATAANLATQPDAQIAAFMVPLTLLVLAVMFEVARFAFRGNLPVHAPARLRAARTLSRDHADD